MTLEKARREIRQAAKQRAKARETLIKAVIADAGANPRKVKIVEVDGFRSLVLSLIPVN